MKKLNDWTLLVLVMGLVAVGFLLGARDRGERAVSVDSLARRRVAAIALRPLAPGYGCCMRCNTPWKFTKGHATTYRRDFPPRRGRRPMSCGSSSGMFPLCESCWEDLGTPEARLPFYELCVAEWAASGYPREELTSEYLLEVLQIEADRIPQDCDPGMLGAS